MLMNSRTIKCLAAAGLSLFLIAPRAGGQAPPAGAAPAGGAIRAEGLTQQQFDALPDSAVLQHKGVRFTKGEFRARALGAHAQAEAKRQSLGAEKRAKFEAYRSKFLTNQQAKLQQLNAGFRAEVTRLQQHHAAQMTPQRQALHRQAWDLVGRARKAPPAERAQFDQRAAQILQRLGGPAPAPAGPGPPPMNVR